MHNFEMPEALVARKIARHGSAHPFAGFDPKRAALVVIDMQNAFLMEGVGHAVCPKARDIAPNVNRLAAALRAAGGIVVWIKNTHDESCLQSWSMMHNASSPEAREKRIAAMSEGTLGHDLWAALEPLPDDLVVKKYRYSAFLQGSSDLPQILTGRGIETVLIAGTMTSVCCDSSARDAMMLNFRTLMVSDACATASDEEHAAALGLFYSTFGDVLSTDELVAELRAQRPAEAPA